MVVVVARSCGGERSQGFGKCGAYTKTQQAVMEVGDAVRTRVSDYFSLILPPRWSLLGELSAPLMGATKAECESLTVLRPRSL